jgi:hypothetical protein
VQLGLAPRPLSVAFGLSSVLRCLLPQYLRDLLHCLRRVVRHFEEHKTTRNWESIGVTSTSSRLKAAWSLRAAGSPGQRWVVVLCVYRRAEAQNELVRGARACEALASRHSGCLVDVVRR